jgi:hypothetical protein
MKVLFLFIITIITISLKGQVFKFYTTDGKLIGRLEDMSINNVNKKLGVRYTHVDSNQDTISNTFHMVGYSMLSNNPSWIYTDNPKKIDSLIGLFDYDRYLNSWRLEMDLDKLIKLKALTDIYLIENLGKPSGKTKTSDGRLMSEMWTYDNMELTLFINNSRAYRWTRTE